MLYDIAGDDDLDEVGDLALVGDDDDLFVDIGDDPVEELLAVAGAGGRKRRMSRGLAARIAKAKAIVSRRPPTAARNAVLGFGPVTVGAGGTASVLSAPQLPFRGERLVFPSDIAGAFRLTSLIVGQANQLPNGNSIPGRSFDERGDGMEIVMDTAQSNSPISIGVVNTSLASQVFEASIRGTMIR